MKRILILGAGFLQTFVIKRAKELGYYTIAVDLNPNAEGFKYADEYAAIDIVNKEECLLYAQEKKIDGVLTAATDYGVLSASYIAEKMSLNGINYQSASCIKNKYLVRKCLFENSADDIEQYYEINSMEDVARIADKVVFPVMVKPCDGSGSKGAAKIEKKEDLSAACMEALKMSLSKKALIESFIDGDEYGAESFVTHSDIYVLAVMKKRMTAPPYYAELGHSVPSELSKETEEKVIKVVKNTIKALGVNFGSVNMDLKITNDNKVCVIDIGARMGGNLIGSHIVPLSKGIDYIGNMIKAAVGDEVDFEEKSKSVVATSLLALEPGKVKELPDFDEIKSKYDLQSVYCHLHEGDNIRFYKNNLDGCGYVVATAQNPGDAIKKVQDAKEEIDKKIIRIQ